MPALPVDALLSIIHRATEEPLGVAIRTNNVQSLMNQLYAAITSQGVSPEELDIMLCTPAIEDHLFIVRRSMDIAP